MTFFEKRANWRDNFFVWRGFMAKIVSVISPFVEFVVVGLCSYYILGEAPEFLVRTVLQFFYYHVKIIVVCMNICYSEG